MDIKIEQISIAHRIIDRIEDENGVYWYPLRMFFLRILCKNEETTAYRDSNLIRYMKVFEYKPHNAHNVVKAWCMNEQGIKFILRRLSIGHGKTEEITELRRKNLSEACSYFGINRIEELQPNYLSIAPDLSDYDIWSVMCINYDPYINGVTQWRRCTKCGYYYPHNKRYFVCKKRKILNQCRQCMGQNFHCHNKIVQYIYQHDGLDLLYAIDKNENNDKIVMELIKFIGKGGHTQSDD